MARKTQQTQTPKASTAPAASKPASEETLIGSNTLPADIEIAEGQTVQLGAIVMKAHARSGLSVEAWNALPEDEREALLAKEVEHAKSAPPVATAASQTTNEPASKGAKDPLDPASKQAAKAENAERVFNVLSRVKRNGSRHDAGDSITLDRAGFEELKRFRAVEGEFEDGKPATA
ncbi:hypothetical protein [Hoeflea sp.]|uniref:hypothetical protein n=1 Tax=Hoeflea sp. TaxID=1940281 RepID=UPI0025C34347|nr:hypothetical protein [Hoeflea sp.]